MSAFLLELASEEIPARMQAAAAEQLARRFTEACAAAGLTHGAVTADATPRRLWLIAHDVAAGSAGSAEEVKGPAASAPAQAIEGFLKKTGLTREQLEERETPKGAVLFAVIRREGRPATDILAEIVPQIVRDFAWPKSMRWGAASASTASPRWVRPLTGIVALLDDAVVPCAAHGISAGRETRGHRVHAPGVISITSAASYADQLRAAHVIVSSATRQQIIAAGAQAAAQAAGLSLIPDAGLVAENAGLTEWPVPLLGRFDPAFLSVPREVIVLTMRTNQKYFALSDSAGALAPAFVCVANLEATDGGTAIIKGNERVLSARLSDARFFWEQDLATVKAGGLEAFLPKLNDIVFHEKLGTLADKVERVAALARWLCESGAVPADPAKAERAARLAKADLVSATVGEFPEVQGIIGRYLALAAGEDPAAADAIRDHYKPAGQGDDVPIAPVSVAVALADKLDTLGRFFANELYPTSSKDPFALRRAALGVLKIVMAADLNVDVFHVVTAGLFGQSMDVIQHEQSIVWRKVVVLDNFFKERFEQLMKEDAVPVGLVRATIDYEAVGFRPQVAAKAIKALQTFVETEDGTNLLAGYKRAANILKATEKEPATAAPAAGIGEGAEAALAAALDAALPAAATAVAAERFTDAMAALAALRAPVDAFFTDVMVNDPDPAIRARRLALLARFRDAVHGVADFSKIEG